MSTIWNKRLLNGMSSNGDKEGLTKVKLYVMAYLKYNMMSLS